MNDTKRLEKMLQKYTMGNTKQQFDAFLLLSLPGLSKTLEFAGLATYIFLFSSSLITF